MQYMAKDENTIRKKRMDPYRILIVEDQPEIFDYCECHLKDGFVYDRIEGGKGIENTLKTHEYDLILLDKNFSHLAPDQLLGPRYKADNEGIEILKKIKSIDNNLPVIMVTGFGDYESVSAAFRLGVFDYTEAEILTKDELILRRKMENAIAGESGTDRALIEKYNKLGIAGSSSAIKEVFRKIEEALKSDSNILLLGETGTGKDVIARVIHRLSNRSDGPFICCDMTHETLFESIFFGIEKRAASGVDGSTGFFEKANGGIIFFNEIGDLPLNYQSKLLIAIEDRKIWPLGANEPVDFDARIISATNVDLEKAIESGKFRRDLYTRLNKIKIILPSLKRRREDIPLLVKYFIDYWCQSLSISSLDITLNAMEYLQKRDYPGNVRELRDMVERLVQMADGHIGIKDVAEYDKYQSTSTENQDTSESGHCYDGKTLEEIERDVIIYNLQKFNGFVKPAHEAMGISRGTIYSRITQYNLKHLTKGYDPPK